MKFIKRKKLFLLLIAVFYCARCSNQTNEKSTFSEEKNAQEWLESKIKFNSHLIEGVILGKVIDSRKINGGLINHSGEDIVLYDAVETDISLIESWQGNIGQNKITIIDPASDRGKFANSQRMEITLSSFPIPHYPPPGSKVIIIYGRRIVNSGRYSAGSLYTVFVFRVSDEGKVEISENGPIIQLSSMKKILENMI
jgi:hypothetical protein